MASIDFNSPQQTGRSTSDVKTDDEPSVSSKPLMLGWREWVSLPELGLPAIKAKVDTGARTSALHAFEIERYQHEDGTDWVAFSVLPIQRDNVLKRRCHAALVDIRSVTDSGGHKEERFFIQTTVNIGGLSKHIEITLAQRDDMLFRMLLGRTTLVPDIIVNPSQSYSLGRADARALYSEPVGFNL